MKFILALPLLFLSACVTPRPGSQTAEIRAEQVLAVSAAALDSFVAFEFRRRADVPPLVRDVARRIRLEAPRALDSANNLRLAYKGNRSAQNEAGLLTALAMVETLVSEIRVWVPATAASETITSGRADWKTVTASADALTREAAAIKIVTAQSWAVLVPVFIDLAREVYAVVNRTREATQQSAEWTLAEEADFAAKLAGFKTAQHWRF